MKQSVGMSPGALKALHRRDFISGDLWETNLLYLPEDGGRTLGGFSILATSVTMEKTGILLVLTLMRGVA